MSGAPAARRIDLIMVDIRLDSALSVAAPEVAVIKGVDLPVAKDPLTSRPYVPTTGVVGALRAHARDCGMEPAALVGLFGGRAPGSLDLDDSRSTETPGLVPSRVRAMGARLVDPAEPNVRSQTAIDRRRGSAVDGSLRTRESVPAGASVELYLSVAGAQDDQLAELRDLIASWRPILGGGRSVGYGRAVVVRARHVRLDLDATQDLTTWLGLGGPGTWDDLPGWSSWPIPPAGNDPRQVQVAFRTSGDLMVGSGGKEATSTGRDASGIMRDGQTPIIPGSALKGVFRSRMEFILRSMGLPTCGSPTAGPPMEPTEPLAPGDSCAEDPCLVCQLFGRAGAAGRRSRLHFADAVLTQAREATRTHVAIDRFTGGAAQGLLFNQVVVESGEVTVTVTVDAGVDLDLARSLIEAVAVDIHEGYVGIGHGTSRGMGALRLSEDDAARMAGAWPVSRHRIVSAAKGQGA